MIVIGVPTCPSSRYHVSRDHQPVRSFLTRRVEVVDIGKHRRSLELQFSANATVRLFATAHPSRLMVFAQAESLRSSLHELEGLLKEYSPLMGGSTESALDKVIKYGVAFSEVSDPI